MQAVLFRPYRPPLNARVVRDPGIPDSTLRRVAALEASLAQPGDSATAARLLWQLVLNMNVLYDLSRSKVEDYAKARPEQFAFNEVGGDYLYGGYHFRELLRRFPEDSLAPHAGYALTQLAWFGEC